MNLNLTFKPQKDQTKLIYSKGKTHVHHRYFTGGSALVTHELSSPDSRMFCVVCAIIMQRLLLSAATNTHPDLCCCLLLTNAVGWMLSCERNPIIFYNMDISWPLVLEGQRSLVLQYPIIPSPTPSPTPTCGPIIYRQHTFLMQSDS